MAIEAAKIGNVGPHGLRHQQPVTAPGAGVPLQDPLRRRADVTAHEIELSDDGGLLRCSEKPLSIGQSRREVVHQGGNR